MARQALLALGVACCLALAMGSDRHVPCIYKFGETPVSVHAPGALVWDYKTLGDDWPGTCANGTHQSPINVPGTKQLVNGPKALRTKWDYKPLTSNGSGNAYVINNGHVIQVQWEGLKSSVKIQAVDAPGAVITDILKQNNNANTKTVIATPSQFHFHTASEHMIKGVEYPLEMHIVHTVGKDQLSGCDPQCFTVTGIMFKLVDGPDNPALDPIFNHINLTEGGVTQIPAGEHLDIQALLPSKKPYVQYFGSLTTPTCLEGLLWHVFTEPNYISQAQMRRLLLAVNDKYCEEVPIDAPEHPSDGNSTETETETEHRRLMRALEFGKSHEHEGHSHTYPSLTGMSVRSIGNGAFVVEPEHSHGHAHAHRHLNEEDSHSTESEGNGTTTEELKWVCKPYAYSQNKRMTQPLNGRVVKYFK